MMFNEQISLKIRKIRILNTFFASCVDSIWNLDILVNWPDEKDDNLHPTDDGEACEESHGATNETQLGLCLDLLVSLDVVKGGCVKEDLHPLNSWRR